MKDVEYDIIDELYFVTPYSVLKEQTGFADNILKQNLVTLIGKGFIKVYVSMNEEAELSKIDMQNKFSSYCYLASKKGLIEHNSR